MEVIIDKKIVSYLEIGSGLPVVFLHGFGHQASFWKNVLGKIPGYRWIIPDLPLFGGTEGLSGNVGVMEYAKWLVAFLDFLKINKCIFIGHSFGAQVLVAAVSHNYVNPLKLILIAPALKRYLENEMPLKLQLLYFLVKLKKLLHLRLISTTDYASHNNRQKDLFRRVIRENVEPYLDKILSPTLFILGEKDKEILGNYLPWVDKKANFKLKIIYDAGHNMHLTHPNQLVRIIKHEIS